MTKTTNVPQKPEKVDSLPTPEKKLTPLDTHEDISHPGENPQGGLQEQNARTTGNTVAEEEKNKKACELNIL